MADSDRDSADETCRTIAGQGGNAAALTVDVGQAASVDRLVRAVRSELGGLHILVNNAGIVIRRSSNGSVRINGTGS